MKITVRYLAQLRQRTGCPTEVVEADGPCSLGQFLASLAQRHASLCGLLVGPGGKVQPTVLLFLGDEQVGPGQDPALREGDEITLLTPIAGGSLSTEEQERYSWQLDVSGFGLEGQRRLKSSAVLVSRCGGVGGMVACELAAAGVGRLVLAHAGPLRSDDLNRQTLMSHSGIGRPRVIQAAEWLRAFNPFVEVESLEENITEGNASSLVGRVDLVVSCAPLFEERLLMNREAVRQGRPLVDCAMYEMDIQLTTVLPGRSPCLACLYPEVPPLWQRRFPVFGAVAGAVGCLGALEAIKVLAGLDEPLAGRLLLADARAMTFRTVAVQRRPGCPVCGSLAKFR